MRGENGCLGFFHGLEALLSEYPEGGLPGEFFVNGRTHSIWVWDATGRTWIDSNHAAPAPFCGVIQTPMSFSPRVEVGTPACYLYVAGGKGIYQFPMLKEGAVLGIKTETAALISLVWDGTVWRSYTTPLNFDNAVRPIYLYQGEWSDTASYRCADGVADVVSYQGKYYQVKFELEVPESEAPDTSNYWELLERFSAIADRLELKANETLNLDRQQTLNIADENSTWSMSDGEITHLETGTMLTKEGALKVPLKETTLLIAPEEEGLSIYSGESQLLHIGVNTKGDTEVRMRQENGDNGYEISINPQQILIAGYDTATNQGSHMMLTSQGINGALKSDTDTLLPGDLYVDKMGIVHYVARTV